MKTQPPSNQRPRILSSTDRRKRVIPLGFQLFGLALNWLSRLHNEWAAALLARLWYTVFKTEIKPWVGEFWQGADERVLISFDQIEIPIYLWGQGPLVVLLHGWSGSGTQYRVFIPQLVAAGFKVACFDAPAHGSNPGKRAHALQFSGSLFAIQAQIGAIDTVVAHSLGAMAAAYARQHGLAARQTVLVAPQLEVQKIFETYRELLGMRPALAQSFKSKIGASMSKLIDGEDPWESLSSARLLKNPNLSGMLVFDDQDPEIAAQSFEQVGRLWPQAVVHRTTGLGHNRILKDKAVIQTVVQHLQA